MKQRSNSLDALRGLAILLMILSGSIAFGGVLPGWMYHAQEPPPEHVFNPALPGITWVDLVFPFFLFSMGAAIPLAIRKRLSADQSAGRIILHSAERYILLIFFALFIVHARAGVMSKTPGLQENLISVGCFILLFMIYGQWKHLLNYYAAMALKTAGVVIGLSFLFMYPFEDGFNVSNNDIIITILANMAFFGSLIWLMTRNSPLLRLGILPFIMAVMLAGGIPGSLNAFIYSWTPAPWMYNFNFLKYLFIIIPATFAGDWLILKEKNDTSIWKEADRRTGVLVTFVILLILICNVACLYKRFLILNFFLTTGFCALLFFGLSRMNDSSGVFKRFAKAGIYLLLLGLFFEAYEGGIKKDISTYSYYFVTSGLAFLLLTAFVILEKSLYLKPVFGFLSANGKNPMVAYTAGMLFLLPVLRMTGAEKLLDYMSNNAAGGFLRGVIFTGIVSLITFFCTRMKLFWRT